MQNCGLQSQILNKMELLSTDKLRSELSFPSYRQISVLSQQTSTQTDKHQLIKQTSHLDLFKMYLIKGSRLEFFFIYEESVHFSSLAE